MKIEVRKSNLHGRGVFAKEDIRTGDIIETCEVLVLNENDTKRIDATDLYNYYFSWDGTQSAIALGYGSLYNHSYTPNAQYTKKLDTDQLIITAYRDIKKGEEITVNYNGNPEEKKDVWFEKR